ncbi:MAG: DUF1080 domain-containing protein [Planctomycetes bacterium]|nr:DUF1080 domain-containing protein [Planctomycetota bacterium]
MTRRASVAAGAVLLVAQPTALLTVAMIGVAMLTVTVLRVTMLWVAMLWVAMIGVALTACHSTPREQPWRDLFDGRSLGPFVSTQFGGEGEVAVHDGAIFLGMGSPLTGINLRDAAAAPTGDYELEVTAARLLGNDFFAAVTFPVGESHLTVVLGGWGGTVCGLSNLDGLDASRNPTRALRSFVLERDYTVRIRVDAAQVTVWLDDEPFVSTPRAGVSIGLRNEMLPCVPLGVSAFATEARIRRVRWRPCDNSR